MTYFTSRIEFTHFGRLTGSKTGGVHLCLHISTRTGSVSVSLLVAVLSSSLRSNASDAVRRYGLGLSPLTFFLRTGRVP